MGRAGEGEELLERETNPFYLALIICPSDSLCEKTKQNCPPSVPNFDFASFTLAGPLFESSVPQCLHFFCSVLIWISSVNKMCFTLNCLFTGLYKKEKKKTPCFQLYFCGIFMIFNSYTF